MHRSSSRRFPHRPALSVKICFRLFREWSRKPLTNDRRGKEMRVIRIAAACLVMQLAGCASIVSGTNQSLSVETRSDTGALVGATCKLTNNKGEWFITTPGSTMVHRSFQDLSISCEKDQYTPGYASAKSSTKPMAFGNIIFGGVIGAGVDISTGAAYDYPNLIVVNMSSDTTQSPSAAESKASTKLPVPVPETKTTASEKEAVPVAPTSAASASAT